MKQKNRFYEPGCYSCKHHLIQGQTRYCRGFPKRRNPRRFRASDPQIKAPSWCPRRITPPILRIYGFRDEQSRQMEMDSLPQFGSSAPAYANPNSMHYKLRTETTTDLTARQFYKRYHKEANLAEIDEELDVGEVIEIDNGLRSCFFFCYNYSTLIPVAVFPTPKSGDGV